MGKVGGILALSVIVILPLSSLDPQKVCRSRDLHHFPCFVLNSPTNPHLVLDYPSIYFNARVELPTAAQQKEKVMMQHVKTIYRLEEHVHGFYF